jgi:hypothetical protein
MIGFFRAIALSFTKNSQHFIQSQGFFRPITPPNYGWPNYLALPWSISRARGFSPGHFG